MDAERIPVLTASELDALDQAEVLEGYRDGFGGFPCGDNRGRSYWHGWRNGMADSGRMEVSPEMHALAKSYRAALPT